MNSQLRRAAILVKSLDQPSAEALLAQMPPAAAKRVLTAAKQLKSVDPDEQREVMHDFLSRQSGEPANAVSPPSGDVELSLSPSSGSPVNEIETPSAPAIALLNPKKPEARFAYVTVEQIEPLASLLGREQPQLAALILAHLPFERSAAVLALLDSTARAAIVQRIAEIDDTSDEVLNEIEQELKIRLMREKLKVEGSAQGLAALSGILQASDPDLRSQISTAIGTRRAAKVHSAPRDLATTIDIEHPPEATTSAAEPREVAQVAQEKQSPLIAFTSLSELDDVSLAAVFGAVSPQVAILALVGANEALVARILKVLPRKEALAFRKKLDEVGPLRLNEVQRAQDQMAHAAGALLVDRRITLPVPQRVRLVA